MTCLSQAPSSAVYRVRLADGRTVIAKLYVGAASWKAAKEHWVMEAIAAHTELNTATVLACGRVPEHDVAALIVTDLGEFSLGRAVRTGSCSRADALRMLGRLLAQFHQLRLEGGSGADPFAVHASFADQLTTLKSRCPPRFVALIEPALQRAVELCSSAADFVWCHGDLHFDNVVLRQGGTCSSVAHVVDFEQMVRAVPEYDVAGSIVTSGALEDRWRAEIAAGYQAALSHELVNALIVFHVMQGWVYAAVAERRDRELWAVRVELMIDRYAGLF